MSTASRGSRRRPPRRSRFAIRISGRWATLLALFACLALIGAMLGGLFRVRQVDIVGGPVAVDSIAQTAGVTGQNIFTIRSDEVVRRLSVMHAFDVTRVDTSFPDRLTIHVLMRRRFLAWQDGSSLYEVDPQGRIIARVRSSPLPTIKGTAPGQSLSPGIVQAVRYAAETLSTAPNGSVAAFQIDPTSGLVIVSRTGWTANVGKGAPRTLVNRIAWLHALLESPKLRHRRIESVDLRYPTPVLRYVGA